MDELEKVNVHTALDRDQLSQPDRARNKLSSPVWAEKKSGRAAQMPTPGLNTF